MSKPGDDLEKVVEVIERSLDPYSRIERNVFLPILTSTENHTAQCDIIIRSGLSHRETLTLIEVQDRSSKVDINMFRGWVLKLEDVGAQHLICVSRKDFPSSIKEKALQYGNKVRLITLKELPKNNLPLDLIHFIFQYSHIDICSIENLQPYVAPGMIKELNLKPFDITGADKAFTTNKIDNFSITELCQHHVEALLHSTESPAPNGKSSLSFDLINEPQLFIIEQGRHIPIGLNADFSWVYDYAEYPMSVAAYEQDEYGALAWVFEVIHKTHDGSSVSIKLPFKKLENGDYLLLDEIINANFDYKFSIKQKNT